MAEPRGTRGPWRVGATEEGLAMRVVIPAESAARFAEHMRATTYRTEERDYKDAVHVVLSALLAPRSREDGQLASRLAAVFGQAMPDLSAVGVPSSDQQKVRDGLSHLGASALRGALANLAGGKWGLAQFAWIPRAVEFGLGEDFAQAFRDLVDTAAPLPARVETFRDRCDEIAVALEQKGGFLPNWRHFRVSLSFVATVLGGYDPTLYTFYAAGALRRGFERYAPAEPWPKGTRGVVYERVCEFVRAVGDELKRQGVPVRDLIDAQSFVWLTCRAAEGESDDSAVETAPGVSPPQAPDNPLDPATVAADLAKAVYWPVDRARRLVDLALRPRPLLFHGPPGTGKTLIAEKLASLLAGEDEGRVEVVQFHPAYAYEDFVEGIRPDVNKGDHLAYELRSGVFLRLAEAAKAAPDSLFFLVIDEINRANLPRVLGELLYALEYRGVDHPFRLPYSQKSAYVPANLRLIATMNSADRSIALVDAAIRRRFTHVAFEPDPDALGRHLEQAGRATLVGDAIARLNALNTELRSLLDRDRLVGHSYLMRLDPPIVDFKAIWEEDIEPVLREHLYNQPDEVDRLGAAFVRLA